jgi:hypothetical protein
MYTIQQHKTKSGKVSSQWNLIKEATGELVTRCVSKVQANACLQELQSFINGKTNENHQAVDQKAPIQQSSESVDIRSDSGVIGSAKQPRADAASSSSNVSQTAGNTMVAQQNQGGSDSPSANEICRQKDQELDSKFKSFLHQSTERTRRRNERIIERSIEESSRNLERSIEESSRNLERVARVAFTAIGIAASVTGVDVGDLDFGTERTIHESNGFQLDQETIEVKSITI